MPKDSTFSAILGYNFLRQFRVTIDSTYTFAKIKDLTIPFIQQTLYQNSTNPLILNVSNNSDVVKNNEIINVQVEQIIPRNNSPKSTPLQDNFTENSYHVKVLLSNKSYIQPNEQLFLQANATFQDFANGDFVFSSIYNKLISMPDSIHVVNSNTQTNESNLQSTMFNFHILAENRSSQAVHFNKGQHIGFLSSIHEIKNTSRTSSNTPNNLTNHVVNVIQPTENILSARREEFNINNFKLNHLLPKQKEVLSKILDENYAAFSTSLKTLGHTDLIKPDIKFTSTCPIKSLPFPIPQALQGEAKRQLQELIDAGIIEKNLSNWACPMLLVKKKAPDSKSPQSYRLALDLRLINTIIESSSYPLPKIQDIISQLTEYTYFTSLDMPSAYHQIHLPEQFQDQLSFATPWSTYKFMRIVFGLKTAAQYFQSMADTVIEEAALEGIFAYQDDFMIGSKDFEEMCFKIQKLLQIFQKHNLTLNPKKCSFHQPKVQYLGFEISQQKVAPIQSNIQKINSFPTPKSKKHVKRFLGVCGYYRHLIPTYAKVSDPLVKLTSPKVNFKWESIHQHAFDTLQATFFQKPFLVQPDFKQPFYLNTDASSFAISAILMQKHDNNFLPISYFSKTLKNSECRYPAIQLELMAIVKGILAFNYYLCGRKFFILSDSKPLSHYSKIVSPVNIISRWLLTLGEYDYEFIHVPGKDNVLADYFSRTPFPDTTDLNTDPKLLNSSEILPLHHETINSTQTTTNKEISNQNITIDLNIILESLNNLPADPLLEITDKTILKEQLNDPNLLQFYNDSLNNKKTSNAKFFSICPTSNILLFYDKNKHDAISPKIALPKSLQMKALKIAHVSHYGIQKTYEFLYQKYYWKGIYADTKNFVQSCTVCATTKNHRIPQAPFQCNPLPKHPGDFISIDLVGPFKNQQYIFTVIDRFSRHMQLYPIKSISSENVIKVLFEYITIHGRPSLIHSDLGTQFTAQIFNDFMTKYAIRLTFSSTAHPQANGISERINQSIKATIRALQEDGYNFKNSIQIHSMMYNSAIHSSTKVSPNLVHFGRDISTLYDTSLPYKPFLATDRNRTFFSIMTDLEGIYKKVYGNLQLAQRLQNNNQTKNARLRNIKEGDIVYLKSTHSFKPSFSGPFKVIQKCGPVNVLLQRNDNPAADTFRVHIDRLWLSPPRRQHLIPDEISATIPSIPITSPPIQPTSNASLLDNPEFNSDSINSGQITPTPSLQNNNDKNQLQQTFTKDNRNPRKCCKNKNRLIPQTNVPSISGPRYHLRQRKR